MRQEIYLQFVYKISSDRILSSKKRNLIITPSEARLNDEIISLSDSNVLRSIDELNGVDRAAVAEKISEIRDEIRRLQQSDNNKATARRRIKELYSQLDKLQLKTDYISVVMSKPSDFDKLNRGFSVNGVEYRRLVGTPSGVKQSIVIFCSVVNEKGICVYEELEKRLNGGRDESKELIPAKFEAYKALACSASVPVSVPKDVLVVDDFVLNVKANYIQLEDSKTSDEPIETYMNGKVELNASDGFGLMCPELAERWSTELGLDYVAGGMCIRNLFCKGMAFSFDFHEFARRYCNDNTIIDIWGTVHNIEDIELILPASVMKLWDSYRSLEHYLECCREYHHGFAVTKTCEKELENERTLNYQFIQSYELTDDEIRELIMPTVNDLKETICGDPDKTLLFLRGACGENYNFEKDDNSLAKALMIAPELANDPYIIGVVSNMLSKKIREAKIGVVKIHGNYTVISGDPFAFCQSIFKCDVLDEEKGLLKAGEIYSEYWTREAPDNEVKKVVCFRAPMSCHNNIKTMNVVHNNEVNFWYQHMPTTNIINCHDMFYPAENGADNDGDAIFTTDDRVLLDKWRDEPAILCVQKKGQKSVITQESLANSNKSGFGNAIGTITNRITAMYDIMSTFSPDSEQHKTLEYRIRCGQQYQQAEIDKIKGIVSKPMPQEWYNIHSVIVNENDDKETIERKNKNREIIADKKPYFMIYIYPQLAKEFRRYDRAARIKSESLFGLTLEELLAKTNRSKAEEDCVKWYWKLYPVFNNGGVMNRLCHIVEKEFEGYINSARRKGVSDYKHILSSGNENKVSSAERKKLLELYKEYSNNMNDISVTVNVTRCSPDEIYARKESLLTEFERQCSIVSPNAETLCDVLIDICYSSDKSKKFVWDMCGEQIVKNLLKKYKGYTYFTLDDSGDVTFGGKTYKRNYVEYTEKESDIIA